MQPCMKDKPQVERLPTNATSVRFGACVRQFMTTKVMAETMSKTLINNDKRHYKNITPRYI